MIVFLLLLLVLVAGFVYFYIKNKGVGVDRPLSEGFEIDTNNAGRWIAILSVYKSKSGGSAGWYGQPGINIGLDWTQFRPYALTYNMQLARQSDINYYYRNGGQYWNFSPTYTLDSASNKTQPFYYTVLNPIYGLFNYNEKGVYAEIASSEEGGWTYFLHIIKPPVVIKDNSEREKCLATGNAIAKRDRNNFSIADNYDIRKLGEEKPADQAALSSACSGALIENSVTFNRQCAAECNETYVNIFSRYGVAFNPQNLSLCDGCNVTEDLIGDANATPPVPRLRNLNAYRPSTAVGDITVSRTLSETGSEYTLSIPQDAKYLLGGVLEGGNRKTRLRYKIDISVINGTEQIYTGTIDNVTFNDNGQQIVKIAFIDGTGFVTTNNNETYTAETTTYHETTGDRATFTISVYADASYDARYDFDNNPGNTYSTYSNASIVTSRSSGATGNTSLNSNFF